VRNPMILGLLGAIICGTAPAGEPAAAPAAPDPSVLKWEGSYWRYHLVLRPPMVTDAAGKPAGILNYYRGWHIGATQARVQSGDVPDGWTDPGFDDSSWVRQKAGPHEGGYMYDPAVRMALARAKFEVPDPARVTKLELAFTFIGGAVAYLNGQEVGRKGLPAGAPTAEMLAEGYPPEAYAWGIPVNKYNYPADMNEWKAPSEGAERFRRVSLTLDPKLLVKGTNVLALAAVRSGYQPLANKWSPGSMNGYRDLPWPHLYVLNLSLRATPADAAVRPARPAGVQVWSDDIHRRAVNRDWGEPAAVGTPAVVRIVGTRNGVHSGMVVVGTAAALAGLSAQVSDLEQVGGAGKIPASAVQLRYGLGTPLDNLPRAWAYGRREAYDDQALRLLAFHALDGCDYRGWGFGRGSPNKEVAAEGAKIALFDHLTEKPPAVVPAASSQPVWVTVRVPRDAPAGQYCGTLAIQAGGALKVEVRLQVMDFLLPDGKDLATFTGLQSSPWSACAQYKCAPWSEDHWKHLERSVRMLGEVGNDLVILPLVTGGEANNDESLVPWVKKGDGYDYDWKNLDRYLDLVAKYWGKNSSVVCELGWSNSGKGWAMTYRGVTTLEGGQKSELKLPAADSDEWKKLFVPFAKAAAAHVKGKGFEKLHWGWFYDSPNGVLAMAEALATECPGVGWARASHDGFRGQSFPKGSTAANLDMVIRTGQEPFTREGQPVSRQGWKKPGAVLFPRIASAIQAAGVFETPMAMRWMPENCLVNGVSGFGRIGADYWPPLVFSNWYAPFQTFLLYPGTDGAEGSARFEALREGLQEAEVRIQLEKAGKDAAEPAKSVLDARIRALSAVPCGDGETAMSEYYGGWQERSWDLYAAAAAAFGGRSPGADEKARFFGAAGK
jgi:hypothetical protein